MEDIDEDEELFSIPISMILSVKNSDLSTKAPEIFLGLDPWLVSIFTVSSIQTLH